MDFATFKSRVIRLLGDTPTDAEGPSGPSGPTIVAGALYSAELLADAAHAALVAITTRQWKNAFADITGSLNLMCATIPADLLEFEGVYDQKIKKFVPEVGFPVNGSQYATWANAWYRFPQGEISFLNSIESGVRIYYSGYWTDPIEDSDLLEPPSFCDNALIYYAASYCALLKSGQSANIRQFNTKVDSGTPEDNPMRQLSNDLMRRFDQEMSRMPMKNHQYVSEVTGTIQ